MTRPFSAVGPSGLLLLVVLASLQGAQAADLTAEDYVHYYKPLLGSWKTTTVIDDEVTHGRTTWRLGANGKCLLVDWAAEDVPATQSLQGYDPRSGLWRMERFNSDGHFMSGTLDHSRVRPGEMMSVGPVGDWKDTVMRDGRPVSRTSKLSCVALGPNQVVLEWTDIKEDENERPDVRFTMQRISGTESVASESQQPGADYEQLKQLEWLIGDWEGEMVVPAGLPEIFPEAATVRSEQSYFWMQNKNYIGFKFRDEIDGKVHHEGFEIVGVDPVTKKLKHWIFSTAGGHGAGDWSLHGQTWQLKWWGILPNEARYEGTSHLTPVNANKHTWQIKDLTRNGEDVPDYPLVEFHRVVVPKAAGQLRSNAAHRLSPVYEKHKILEDLSVGKWAIRGTTDGAEMVGELIGKWAPGKYCVFFSGHVQQADGSEKTHLSGLIGWDKMTGKIKEQTFASDGSSGTAYFDVEGNVLVGERNGINAQGQEYRQQLRFTVGENRWVGSPTVDRGSDGEPLAEHGEWVFTRSETD